MNQIKYQIHLILQSNYKLLINLVIFSILYLSIYGQQQIVFCMTEGEVPIIAEAKSIASHQVQALKREIIEYANLQAPLLEQIEAQNKEIAKLYKQITKLEKFGNDVSTEIREYIERDLSYRQHHIIRNWEQIYDESDSDRGSFDSDSK